MDEPETGAGHPYRDDTGQPVLRESVVAWLDILGFKDAIARAGEAGKEQEVVRVLSRALADLVERLKPMSRKLGGIEPRKWLVKAFTDNFVVGYPVLIDVFPTNGYPELTSIAWRIGDAQLDLAKQGYFLRGGVSVGPLYMDEHLVFGAALLEAQEIEATRARDPRIILAPSARAVVEAEAKRWEGGPARSMEDAVFWEDVDGEAFVNYLGPIVEFEHDMEGYVNMEPFEQHGEMLKAKLAEFAGEPVKWAKYAWAARYHNAFLDIRSDFPDESRVEIQGFVSALKPFP